MFCFAYPVGVSYTREGETITNTRRSGGDVTRQGRWRRRWTPRDSTLQTAANYGNNNKIMVLDHPKRGSGCVALKAVALRSRSMGEDSRR